MRKSKVFAVLGLCLGLMLIQPYNLAVDPVGGEDYLDPAIWQEMYDSYVRGQELMAANPGMSAQTCNSECKGESSCDESESALAGGVPAILAEIAGWSSSGIGLAGYLIACPLARDVGCDIGCGPENPPEPIAECPSSTTCMTFCTGSNIPVAACITSGGQAGDCCLPQGPIGP